LTPKAGRQRDPAKTLAGTEFREAKEARELVTVLGRSGKPIISGRGCRRPGSSCCTGFRSSPGPRPTATSIPIVSSSCRGGAAPWYRHITPHYEEIFSFFTPDEFRIANERRIVEQGGRQKHIEVTSFDREISRAYRPGAVSAAPSCCIHRRCISCSTTSGCSARRSR
jgi:hypothetical protein